jgi:hypothetical protein
MEKWEEELAVIRAIMAENAKEMAENAKGFAELREQQKKTDEQQKRTDEQIKRTEESLDRVAKMVGGISENIGLHAEQYFQDALSRKLEFGGQKYDYMIPNMKYNKKGLTAEFDIVLVNGTSIAIIETKNRIHPNFIKEIAQEKTAQFRKYFSIYEKYKLYIGVAGFSFDDEVEQEAKEYGVGIIRQLGDSVEIDDENLKVY